ncbi:hypothetical protein D3C74_219440 [compost metagenome]
MSLNLYTYVHNNPLRYTDPSGHIPIGPSDIWRILFQKETVDFINSSTKKAETKAWKAFASGIDKAGIHSTAFFIKHSLNDNPSDVYLNQWSYEASLINNTKKYQDLLESIVKEANNKKINTIDEKKGISFESNDNKDLFVGIHSATLKIKGEINENGRWSIQVKLEDYFDFENHPEKVKDFSFSSAAWAANNVAAYSNSSGVINSYWIYIDMGTYDSRSWKK